jgi:hypothetical protein
MLPTNKPPLHQQPTSNPTHVIASRTKRGHGAPLALPRKENNIHRCHRCPTENLANGISTNLGEELLDSHYQIGGSLLVTRTLEGSAESTRGWLLRALRTRKSSVGDVYSGKRGSHRVF